MKEKKIKWMKPKLEKLDKDETKGQCMNGSGNVDLCAVGTGGTPFGVCVAGGFVV